MTHVHMVLGSVRGNVVVLASSNARVLLTIAKSPLAHLLLTSCLFQVLAALQAENMLPAIWFIMNRKDCDVSAITADVILTSDEEQDIIQQELQQLR